MNELQATVAAKAQELLESLNSSMAIAKKKSANMNGENLKRIGFGMYYFESESLRSTNKDDGKKKNDD